MAQPYSLMARWRRAYWQRCGERCLLKTIWPHGYAIGSELQHQGVRYRLTRYDLDAAAGVYEVWGKPLGESTAPTSRGIASRVSR